MTRYLTNRPTCPEIEQHMYQPHKVLDHGFIILVDYMGDESAIIEAARTSYGAGTRTISNDVGLLRYLMRMRHTSPLEMLEVKFLLKMPLFVARQWLRHRMSSTNERSARYSILEKEFYIPSPDQLAAQSTVNKQGRGETLSATQAHEVLSMLKADAEQNYEHYEEMLNETIDKDGKAHTIVEGKMGIARELARMNLTLNYYTTMVWKIDLHNLLHFLSLRADAHAQWEIRQYANVMLDIIEAWCPNVASAFEDYRRQSVLLSRQEVDVVKHIVRRLRVHKAEELDSIIKPAELSGREWDALKTNLGF